MFPTKKSLLILLLGFSCGLPSPITLSILSVFLYEYGFTLESIGLASMVQLPYTLKPLWSPLLDHIKPPLLSNLGKRRGWLIVVQCFLFCSVLLLGQFNPKEYTFLIIVIALLIAFFSASQDIIVDALRVESFSDDNQGVAVAYYIFGYRTAMFIASAGGLYLAHLYGWEYTFTILASLLIIGVLAVVLIDEPEHTQQKPYHNFKAWVDYAFIAPFQEFTNRHNWFLVLLFVLLYKLSDAYLASMSTPFLLNMGFSKLEIAQIVKSYGLGATLIGTMIGGYFIKIFNVYTMLFWGAMLAALSNLAYIIQYYAGHNIEVLMLVIGIDNIAGGLSSAIFIAYIGILCNKQFTATQFALLTSLSAVGRSMISASSGFVIHAVGWVDFFIFSAILCLPAMAFIKWINNKQ